MGFLKGPAVILLHILLFLSLSAFGLAFMLNSTILNPGFVTSELNKLDVTSLAEEIIIEQYPREEFVTELVNTVSRVEPVVKEQARAAIYTIYDYLLGKSESLDLLLIIRNTLLSADFIVSIVDELDTHSLAAEFIREQLTKKIPAEVGYMVEYLDKSLNDVITELEPSMKEQLSAAADPIADYLLGKSPSLNVTISMDLVMESLRYNMWRFFLDSPPSALARLPQVELERRFNEIYQDFSKHIPLTFEIDESLFDTEVSANITEALDELEEVLEEAKQHISSVRLGYRLLIGFIVLLVLGIIVMNHNVKNTTMGLGITSLTYGAIEFGGIFAADHFGGKQLAQLDLPSSLQTWLTQFVGEILSPLEIFSIVLMVVGVALIIISVIYKRKHLS